MKKFYKKFSFDDDCKRDDYFGDQRLRPYLDYEKSKIGYTCVYCSGKANSREHIPSKCFIDKPYPKDLLILPSCDFCNKKFSKDEEFVSCLVEFAYCYYHNKNIERVKFKRTLKHTPALLHEIKAIIENHGFVFSNFPDDIQKRIKNIAFKLVHCHSVYEMSELMTIDARIDIFWIQELTKDQINYFNSDLEYFLFPEIGSRLFTEIVVNSENIPVYGWKFFQPFTYRYLVSPKIVRIVLREILCIEAILD